jgi:hypothetical protein
MSTSQTTTKCFDSLQSTGWDWKDDKECLKRVPGGVELVRRLGASCGIKGAKRMSKKDLCPLLVDKFAQDFGISKQQAKQVVEKAQQVRVQEESKIPEVVEQVLVATGGGGASSKHEPVQSTARKEKNILELARSAGLRVTPHTTAQEAIHDLVRALTNVRKLSEEDASNAIHRALRSGKSSTRHQRLVQDLMQQISETTPRSVNADDDVLEILPTEDCHVKYDRMVSSQQTLVRYYDRARKKFFCKKISRKSNPQLFENLLDVHGMPQPELERSLLQDLGESGDWIRGARTRLLRDTILDMMMAHTMPVVMREKFLRLSQMSGVELSTSEVLVEGEDVEKLVKSGLPGLLAHLKSFSAQALSQLFHWMDLWLGFVMGNPMLTLSLGLTAMSVLALATGEVEAGALSVFFALVIFIAEALCGDKDDTREFSWVRFDSGFGVRFMSYTSEQIDCYRTVFKIAKRFLEPKDE